MKTNMENDKQNRRDMFKTLARYGLVAGGLAGLALMLGQKRIDMTGQAGNCHISCNKCPQKAKCNIKTD